VNTRFLGIDLGTSGVRACVIDAAGTVHAQSAAPLPPSTHPCAGCSEQRPNDWWQVVLEVVDALPADCRRALAGIAVDGTSGTLLLTDHDGEPLGPAWMYDDRRARAQAERLAAIAPPQAAVHSPSSTLAKLLHRLENGAGQAAHALHQADWIAHRLGAPLGLSDENNSLKLGYDPVTRRWPDWLTQTGVPARLLPRVVPVGQAIGELTPALRDRWDCERPVRLFAGTTDSNAATLATGIRDIGEASTALGSTLVLKVLSERPVFAPEYGVYSHRLGDRWLVGGASNSGGAVLRQFFDEDSLSTLSERIDPQADSGLDYYPLPAPGERFPVNDPAKLPRIAPRPADDVRFLHGLLEGIARIEREGYRRLHALGAPRPRRVLSSGGGAVNATWRALRERLLGVPVLAADCTEAACGTAHIAAGLLGSGA